jgi:broad specificity phosphatase PhoE
MSEIEQSRPTELVFVRHGESEANIVYQIAKERGGSYSEEFRKKPNSEMELSPRGVEQALAAGRWIKENINGGVFAQYYVSPFKRAMHTAGYLQLPESETKKVWKVRDYIREQSYGYFDSLTTEEQKEKYPEIMARKNIDGIYWARLGGESMADLVFRTKIGIVQTLYREVPGQNAIVVAHGNLLWAVRIIMEGLTYERYKELDSQGNPMEKMNNCQVLQYTRVDPSNPMNITNNFGWMRSVCPWDTSLSNNNWRKIERLKYTNSDLLSR